MISKSQNVRALISVVDAKDIEPGFRVFAHLKVGEITVTSERKTFDGQTTKVAEVIVGDETGCVNFLAKDDTLKMLKTGEVYQFLNAHAAVVKEHMRLDIDKWAQLKPSDKKVSAINTKNNLSDEEYEKIPLETNNRSRRSGRRN